MARPKKKEVRYKIERVEHCGDGVTGSYIRLSAEGNAEILLELDAYTIGHLYEAAKKGIQNVAECMETHALWLRKKV